MKMKALDTLHISNVSAEPIRPGQTFTINQQDGQSLVKRGLAVEVGAKKARTSKNKAARTSKNKAARAPENKSA